MTIKEMGIQFANAVYSSTMGMLGGGINGAIVGFVYGKLANLPASQTTKAYGIWYAAEGAISNFASAFTNKPSHQLLIRATVIALSGTFGIQELRKRGLMGDKMMAFSCVMRVMGVAALLTFSALTSAGEKKLEELKTP